MSLTPQSPPPGWYPNSQGHTQWWDGQRWGPYAPPSVPQRPLKDAGIAYLLLILLGGFGAHRFYLGQAAVGVIILVLWCGGLLLSFLGVGFFMMAAAGIWLFVDLFLIPGMTREANGQPS